MLEARGIENVTVHPVGMLRDLPSIGQDSFDRILIDVPCSNSGVLARRPEARYAQDERSLRSLEQLQHDILDDTAPCLVPGGLLVYSTCSVWPQENEDQVRAFIAGHADYELHHSRTTLPSFHQTDPSRYHDGGFVAVLRRN